MNRRATILAVVTSAAVVGTLGVLGLSTALAATVGPITGRSLGRDRQCPGAYPNYDLQRRHAAGVRVHPDHRSLQRLKSGR
jgi:hypothetical protein